MQTGAITGYIDVAQLSLYAFWIFFAGLIFYLRREDKREGYPLESDRSSRVTVQGFPAIPALKTYLLKEGGTATLPNYKNDRRDAPVVAGAFPGAPMIPLGNPMLTGVGAASYANRDDHPELTFEGVNALAPMRDLPASYIEARDPDPRGMQVVGADGMAAGTVRDVWIDRAEALIRYLEVEVATPAGPRNVLLPMTLARVSGHRRQVKVKSILAAQFADVPALAVSNQVTKLEEDKIMGYFGGGHLHATPGREEPIL